MKNTFKLILYVETKGESNPFPVFLETRRQQIVTCLWYVWTNAEKRKTHLEI